MDVYFLVYIYVALEMLQYFSLLLILLVMRKYVENLNFVSNNKMHA